MFTYGLQGMCMRRFISIGICVVAAVVWAPPIVRGELIVNGDFEAGVTGFTSEYELHSNLEETSGRYNVGSDPQSFNPFFNSFTDHTPTGLGNMLIVNGSSAVDPVVVWSQTVAVDVNTSYAFGYWGSSAVSFDSAMLRVTINGADVGSNALSTDAGDWQHFVSYWNSGGATSAQINIYEDTHAYLGNDFALDDMSFTEGAAVPEPSSLALVGGLVGGAWWKRRRKVAARGDSAV